MEDLAIFSTRENNFWVTDVTKNKGIQCRLGSRGMNCFGVLFCIPFHFLLGSPFHYPRRDSGVSL